MPGRGLAAVAYLPVPGLAWLVVRQAPADRLVRHHGRQAGWLTALAWVSLLACGYALQLPALAGPGAVAAGAVLALWGLAAALGVVAAARGRFLRLRPVWDLAALSAPGPRRSRRS